MRGRGCGCIDREAVNASGRWSVVSGQLRRISAESSVSLSVTITMPQKLQALVREIRGTTKHGIGTIGPYGPEMVREMPAAVRVEITADDDGIFLLRFDTHGEFCGDTWHETIDEAMEAAQIEYGITASDWSESPLE